MKAVLVLALFAALANAQVGYQVKGLTTTSGTLTVTAPGAKAGYTVTAFTCATATADNSGTVPGICTCTITITGDELQNARGSVIFVPSSSSLDSAYGGCAGTTGTLTCSIAFSKWTRTGTYSLVGLNVYNQVSAYSTSTTGTMGQAATLTVTGVQDITAPTGAGFSFSPASLDVSATAPYTHAAIRAYVNCTDMESGCTGVSMYLQPPAGSPVSRLLPISFSPVSFSTCYGQAGNCQWQTSSSTNVFAKPASWISGTWTIVKISMYDSQGNTVNLEGGALAALGGSLTLTVNQPAAPVTKLFNILSYVHAPIAIDVTTNMQTVQHNCTIEGTYAIADRPTSVSGKLSAPDTRCSSKSISFSFVEETGGNTVYSRTMTYSNADTCNGAYTAQYVVANDKFGSRSVAGSCTSSDSSCSDPRVEPAKSAAGTVQASFLVALAAIVAALLA